MVSIDLTKDEVCKFLKSSDVLTIMDLMQNEDHVLIAKMIKINDNCIFVNASVLDAGDSVSNFELFTRKADIEINDYKAQLRNELNKMARTPMEREAVEE